MVAILDAAARRARAMARAAYPGEIVSLGTPKPALYAHLSPLERLAQMSALCRAQWLASGGVIADRPRAEWSGKVFVIDRG
ncbi:MAG: hypothetical protein ABI488_13755 [Polyangiaceae bacterium]